MQDSYLNSGESSIAGISDAGNIKGVGAKDPNFKNAVRRQATLRVQETSKMPGLALGILLQNSLDAAERDGRLVPFEDLDREMARLSAGLGRHDHDPRLDEVA